MNFKTIFNFQYLYQCWGSETSQLCHYFLWFKRFFCNMNQQRGKAFRMWFDDDEVVASMSVCQYFLWFKRVFFCNMNEQKGKAFMMVMSWWIDCCWRDRLQHRIVVPVRLSLLSYQLRDWMWSTFQELSKTWITNGG